MFYKDDPGANGKGEYTCDEFKSKFGVKYCCFTSDKYCSTSDEWANGVKICGGVGNLMTGVEALKLMQYLYDDNTLQASDSKPEPNEQKANELKNYGILGVGIFGA